MRKARLITLTLTILGLLLCGSVYAETTILNGEYKWNRGSSGKLEAKFTKAGDGVWNVAFYFKFRGQQHTYRGQAQGSLTDGGLKGEVKNDNGRRTFTFNGGFENGQFSGNHAEIERGKPYKTGTMTLKRREEAL